MSVRIRIPETKNKPAAVGSQMGWGAQLLPSRAAWEEPLHENQITGILAACSFSPSLHERAEVTEVSYTNMIRPVNKLNFLQWVLSRLLTWTTSVRAPISHEKLFRVSLLGHFCRSFPHVGVKLMLSLVACFTHKVPTWIHSWNARTAEVLTQATEDCSRRRDYYAH